MPTPLLEYRQLMGEWIDAGRAADIENLSPEWLDAVDSLTIRKHYGPGPHQSGSEQSAHGGGGGKPSAPLGSRIDDAKAIFDQTIVTAGDGKRYISAVTVIERGGGSAISIEGVIEKFGHGIGERVGSFERVILNPTDRGQGVYNGSLTILSEVQGQGVATAMLAAWEDNMRAEGVKYVKLQATNIGKYAWAVAGYEFDWPRMDHSPHRRLASVWKDPQINAEIRSKSPKTAAQIEALLKREPMSVRPVEYALLGAGEPPMIFADDGGRPYPFGKGFLIISPDWYGIKEL